MVNCLARAGAETQMVRLAVELHRRGHEVGVLSILPPQAFTQVLADAGIPLVALATGTRYDEGENGSAVAKSVVLRGIVTAVRALRAWRTQALVCFIHEASLFGRFVGRLARVPVVIGSERNVWREGNIDARISRWSDRLLSATVVNTPSIAADLIDRGIVPPDRVTVVPNGIDVDAYQPSHEQRVVARSQMNAGDDFLWLAVGRLTPQKDYPTLLSAFRTTVERHPATRLLIAGSGTLRPDLEARASTWGVAQRTSFLGERSDITQLLHAADGLVMSSESEGLPNAIMEAYAARLPVVATAVGGVPELVMPGRTGMLVPPADPLALAAAMCALMDLSPSQRALLATNGQDLVRSRFDIQHVASKWIDIIERHVGQHGRGRARRSRAVWA